MGPQYFLPEDSSSEHVNSSSHFHGAPDVDPAEGVTYSWQNLDVYATSGGGIFRSKRKEIHILKGGKEVLVK